jgi:hypothetical protein
VKLLLRGVLVSKFGSSNIIILIRNVQHPSLITSSMAAARARTLLAGESPSTSVARRLQILRHHFSTWRNARAQPHCRRSRQSFEETAQGYDYGEGKEIAILTVAGSARTFFPTKAGDPVDQTITHLLTVFEKDDIIIDGGNSHYPGNDAVRALLRTRSHGAQTPSVAARSSRPKACTLSVPASVVAKRARSRAPRSCRVVTPMLGRQYAHCTCVLRRKSHSTCCS